MIASACGVVAVYDSSCCVVLDVLDILKLLIVDIRWLGSFLTWLMLILVRGIIRRGSAGAIHAIATNALVIRSSKTEKQREPALKR